MGDSRVQVDAKNSSTLTPGFKPEESSFLKQRYQDRVEEETTSPTAEKLLSTSGQTTPTPPPSDPPPVSHSFGRISVLPIQTKLTIGQPNDKYEQEADRVAEQVMRMPEPGSSAAAITRPVRSPVVQRFCSECQEELQRQPLEETEDEEEIVRAKPIEGLVMPVIQRQQAESEEEEEDKLQMKPLGSQITPLIQRQAESSEEEDEETVQTKPVIHQVSPLVQRQVEAGEKEEEEEEILQTKPLVSRISPLIQRMEEPTEEDEEKLQTKLLTRQFPPLVQRMEEPTEEDEENLQTKPLTCQFSPLIQRMSEPTEEEDEEEEQTVRTKENPGQAPSVTSTLEARLNTIKGSGQPLSEETRSFMEPRFGHDFSQVRVHADREAVQLNRDLRAQAFTHGQDVYFGAGRYNPESSAGKQLLAHELTHVVQQNGNKVQRKLVSNKAKEPEPIEPIEAKQLTRQTSNKKQNKVFTAGGKKTSSEAKKLDSNTATITPGVATAKTPLANTPAKGSETTLTQSAGTTNAETASVTQEAASLSAEDPGQIIKQLKNTPPTQAAAAYAQSQTASVQALENQKQEVRATIPEIPAPTDLSSIEKITCNH